MDGYSWDFELERLMVTIWSAPNWRYKNGNEAAIMQFDEHMNFKLIRFTAAPYLIRQKGANYRVPDYFV